MKNIRMIQFILIFIIGLTSCQHITSQKTNITPLYSSVKSEKIYVEIDTTWEAKLEKPDSYWKEKLTTKKYHIAREKGTERAFTHPYNKNKKEGIYVCSSCRNPLYSSETKFKSGTGWPSFWDPYYKKSVIIGADNSHGMSRDEVVCAKCDAHLGHVFNDGPKPTGLRYCMNGESLEFVDKKQKIDVVFAQGCFWCLEIIFDAVKGVEDVVSGYSGGDKNNPSYEEVGRGSTKHAEAVKVTYDPSIISYAELLKVYFNAGDITQVNGQGNDKGIQYRSIVFYTSIKQEKMINDYIQKIEDSGDYDRKVSVDVDPFKKFYPAEDYHQNFVKLHPNHSYVNAVSIPRYVKAIKKFPELLKQ